MLMFTIIKLVAVAVMSLHMCLAETTKSPKPNIVFILTDDQDTYLGGLDPMAKVKTLLRDQGTEFTNMFASTPLCCPSRTSILTGRYQHNHNTLNNSVSGNCSSKFWQQTLEKETLATHAKSLGYRTFFAGKYLNQYGGKAVGGPQHVPPGWDEWLGLVRNSVYYNYTISENGQPHRHGDDYYKDYLTDLIANRSVRFIKNHANEVFGEPFLMMLSTPAPHSPWDAAPQHSHAFENGTAPRTPNYNKRAKNQHWLMRQANIPMKQTSVEYADNAFRKRWQTLLSVDDLVEKVVQTLDSSKLLNTTYIIYSSDNGYHLGQYGLPIDKRQLYDFDLRVPLIIRGPGVPKNVSRAEPVLNIDLTPTMLDIANGSTGFFPQEMDGVSFVPLLHDKVDGASNWRKDFAVEYQGEGKTVQSGCPHLGYGVSNCFPDCVCEDAFNNSYSCVRTLVPGDATKDLMYCEFADSETFVELYNLSTDPYQLDNIKDSVDPTMLVHMNSRLIELGFCKGDSCRQPGRHRVWPDVTQSEGLRPEKSMMRKFVNAVFEYGKNRFYCAYDKL